MKIERSWEPKRRERASLPWVCNSCGQEGFAAWEDFPHAWVQFIEFESKRFREALERIFEASSDGCSCGCGVHEEVRAMIAALDFFRTGKTEWNQPGGSWFLTKTTKEGRENAESTA